MFERVFHEHIISVKKDSRYRQPPQERSNSPGTSRLPVIPATLPAVCFPVNCQSGVALVDASSGWSSCGNRLAGSHTGAVLEVAPAIVRPGSPRVIAVWMSNMGLPPGCPTCNAMPDFQDVPTARSRRLLTSLSLLGLLRRVGIGAQAPVTQHLPGQSREATADETLPACRFCRPIPIPGIDEML